MYVCLEGAYIYIMNEYDGSHSFIVYMLGGGGYIFHDYDGTMQEGIVCHIYIYAGVNGMWWHGRCVVSRL